jgi:hypothetical protein
MNGNTLATIKVNPIQINEMAQRVGAAGELAMRIASDPRGVTREELWALHLLQSMLPDPGRMAAMMAELAVDGAIAEPQSVQVDVFDLLRLHVFLTTSIGRLTKVVTDGDAGDIMERIRQEAGDGSPA